MMGSTVTAVVLLLLTGGAVALATMAAQTTIRSARMHRRSVAVGGAAGLARGGGRLLRDADPLLGTTTPTAADAWLLQTCPGAAKLAAGLADAGFGAPLSRVAGGALALAFLLVAGLQHAGASWPIALLVAVVLAYLGPRLILKARIARRRKQFQRLLPEAIGLMVRGLRAGVPVSETVAEVGREIVEPLGGAFRRAHQQVRLGQPLEAALLAETRAMNNAAMNFLIVTLSVQRETGGNLAETLDKLDDIIRRREQMQLKVKAMSSEAKASAFIIGSLPIFMGALMAVISPDYIMPLFTTTAGHVLLGGAALSLAVGGWLMAQLVSFDI